MAKMSSGKKFLLGFCCVSVFIVKPPFAYKNPKMEHALELLTNREENGYTVKKICEVIGVSRTVLYERAKEKGIM